MYFEVVKGRACDSLQVLNSNLIRSQGEELLAKDGVIVLQKTEVSQLEALLKNCEELGNLSQQKFEIQKQGLKLKIKKLIRVVVVEGGVIVVMIILLV
jgi:tRNA A58 N-methylase Trm61